MVDIPIQSIWPLLRHLPSWLLRRFFPREKLSKLIYIDVLPRHDSAVVDLGTTATFTLWFQAINLSPFEVELDRAEVQFWIGGAVLSAALLRRQRIAPGEIVSFHVKQPIPSDSCAEQIARLYKGNRPAVSGRIEFNCALHPFSKDLGHLDGVHVDVMNEQQRLATATSAPG